MSNLTPELFVMLDEFDRLNGAIDRVLTALPGQMTDAAGLLENRRAIMRDTMNRYVKDLAAIRKGGEHA